MLSLLAAVVLSSTGPSAANLADRFVFVQQAPPAQQPTQGYEGWNRGQLLAERDRLDLSRPSIVLPVVALACGAGAVIVSGLTLFYAGLFALAAGFVGGSGSRIDTGVLIFCAVLAIVGAAGITAGLIFLLPTLRERSAIGKQMDRVNDALEQLDRDPGLPPPPPPPVGNQVSRPAPWLTITLARF